ncbi:hypothetical protein VP01_682g1 [Puccinia sorghi]|uniref:Uncharacterized protein n=1 Tax=Puccinia sorghi TaxID=27349 RepID=A0A0L6UEI6_9BASI|nr:hypothetical protein VP01_682g1 [Puccinia sorghi]
MSSSKKKHLSCPLWLPLKHLHQTTKFQLQKPKHRSSPSNLLKPGLFVQLGLSNQCNFLVPEIASCEPLIFLSFFHMLNCYKEEAKEAGKNQQESTMKIIQQNQACVSLVLSTQ